jgi:hypothetical protein
MKIVSFSYTFSVVSTEIEQIASPKPSPSLAGTGDPADPRDSTLHQGFLCHVKQHMPMKYDCCGIASDCTGMEPKPSESKLFDIPIAN